MTDLEASATLRLGQFLDLAGQWLGTCPAAETSHRICRTASLLLDIPYVALGLVRNDRYDVIGASLPDASDGDDVEATVLEAALASRSPQLRSSSTETIGVFPFGAAAGVEGCLYVRVERPLLSATEISCLRFVASLSAVMLASSPTVEPAHAGVSLPGPGPGAHARRESVSAAAKSLSQPVEADAAPGNGTPPVDSAARRYVAMAVHDLRNPLNVVAGYAALLEEECLGPVTPEQREAVEAIGRQARVLHTAVDQLIDLDRMRSGDEVRPSHFQLRGLFEEIRRTCFPDANGRVRWPGRESEFEFRSDRRRIYSIVQNLVDNALKHTSEEEVYVACEHTDGDLVVLVCDHGPGLSHELRAKLVAHARTGDESAPRSGLGLYSVASHVHALGGAVDVEIADAGGTAVRVCIPPAAASDASPDNPNDGGEAAVRDATAEAATDTIETNDDVPTQDTRARATPARRARRRPPRDVGTGA